MTPAEHRQNGQQGYYAAIALLRRKGLLEGRYQPINEDERRLVAEERCRRAFDRLRQVVEGT